MKELEKITFEPEDRDALICLCGNTPTGAGFYHCNLNGDRVEPTEKDWTTGLYVCDDCGRIIDHKTLNVVGKNLKIASEYERCAALSRNQAQADFEKWLGGSDF